MQFLWQQENHHLIHPQTTRNFTQRWPKHLVTQWLLKFGERFHLLQRETCRVMNLIYDTIYIIHHPWTFQGSIINWEFSAWTFKHNSENCALTPPHVGTFPSVANSMDLNPNSSRKSLQLLRTKACPVSVWLRARKYLYLKAWTWPWGHGQLRGDGWKQGRFPTPAKERGPNPFTFSLQGFNSVLNTSVYWNVWQNVP